MLDDVPGVGVALTDVASAADLESVVADWVFGGRRLDRDATYSTAVDGLEWMSDCLD